MNTVRESQVFDQLQKQRSYMASGTTKELSVRKEALKRLKASIQAHSSDIEQALWKDLHKSAYETYMTEVSIVLHELDMLIRNMDKWARPRKVSTPFYLWPSKSRILTEPYGHVLIIGPWNYPFQLIMAPLVAAIAAGNVVALKPPHETPETAEMIRRIVTDVFDEKYVSCFIGETEISTFLLAQRFDYIFFTGSPRVGKIVMTAAANYLTPVTLELGGKSPCIVDKTADIKIAAKRIVWGKLINAGQTCIAPDYLLVHSQVKDALLNEIKTCMKEFYGDNPKDNPDYVRIISSKAMDRLAALIEAENVYYGGVADKASNYISPTILTNVLPESPIMQEEIFGPILPVLEVNNIDEAIQYVQKHEKPLALYFFGDKSVGKRVLKQTSSGGACINDTILHIANSRLPFGGIGNSGMGSYHGKTGFDTFTHHRSVLISRNWIDIKIKYPPYKNISWLKRLM